MRTKVLVVHDEPEIRSLLAQYLESGGFEVIAAERHAIRQALRSPKGNKSQAARLLRTDYTTPHAKMKRCAISPREFTEG